VPCIEANLGLPVRRKTAYCTTCVMTADVLPENALVAPYTALMLCFPLLSVDVLNVAVPVPSRVPVPSVVLPSLKLQEIDR
jgi:hypothetical protein